MKDPNDWPAVRTVTVNDIVEVLGEGVRDLRAAPKYGLAVGLLYAAVGWFIIALLFVFGLPYFAYPMAMGFALIAPFAGVCFYAVSDYLGRGKELSWSAVLGAVREAAGRDIRWMALVTAFTFFFWIDMAAITFLSIMGFEAIADDFLDQLLTTPKGFLFLIVGNIAGAVLALCVFSISVVTYPMLYDRDVDFVTAMVTSVRLVVANPITMLFWCALIGILTGLSFLSFFLGLIVMLPVVGHASWHLYKRAVEPEKTPQSSAVHNAIISDAG